MLLAGTDPFINFKSRKAGEVKIVMAYFNIFNFLAILFDTQHGAFVKFGNTMSKYKLHSCIHACCFSIIE